MGRPRIHPKKEKPFAMPIPKGVMNGLTGRNPDEPYKTIVEPPEGIALKRTQAKKGKRAVGEMGRMPLAVSLTRRLRQVLAVPAFRVECSKNYCEVAGLNPHKATVMDTLIHCCLYWAFRGSHPHLNQIWERIDGKVPMKAEVNLTGKMGITEAVAALRLGEDSEAVLKAAEATVIGEREVEDKDVGGCFSGPATSQRYGEGPVVLGANLAKSDPDEHQSS